MKSGRFACVAIGTCLLVATLALAFQPVGGYHLLRRVSLATAPGDTGYFDYITFDSAVLAPYSVFTVFDRADLRKIFVEYVDGAISG
jgi:hypothetical protein